MAAPTEPATDPRILRMDADLVDPMSLLLRSMTNPIHGDDPQNIFNRPVYHQTPLPSANAIGTARSMAALYSAVVSGTDGEPLLSRQLLGDAIVPRSKGEDACLHFETSWGLGYGLRSELFAFPNESCFGHCGTGGSVAFGDVEAELAFAYLPNGMQRKLDDPRADKLVAAVYDAL
jgi:CubicO group peptidase (beta-lactamase class C family)